MADEDDSLAEVKVPDSVGRVRRLLAEVAGSEIEPLDLPEDDAFVYDVFNLEHPFGQAWCQLYDVAASEFNVVRLGKTCVDASNPDNNVHFHAYHPDLSERGGYCSVGMYVDGSTRIRSKVRQPDSKSTQTFLELDRDTPMTMEELGDY